MRIKSLIRFIDQPTPANVRKILARVGRLGGLPFPVHPYMLRHAARA